MTNTQVDWYLFLLGTPALYRGDAPVLLSLPLQAILAHLALADEAVPLADLVALLDPEPPSATTLVAAVSTELAGLVQESASGWQLRSSCWVDVAAFEAIQLLEPRPGFEAVVAAQVSLFDLYGGDFLADFPLAQWPVFAAWLVLQRQRLRQAYEHTLRRLIDTYRRSNNWPQITALVRHALTQPNPPPWLSSILQEETDPH